jgi:hypothetical protein
LVKQSCQLNELPYNVYVALMVKRNKEQIFIYKLCLKVIKQVEQVLSKSAVTDCSFSTFSSPFPAFAAPHMHMYS